MTKCVFSGIAAGAAAAVGVAGFGGVGLAGYTVTTGVDPVQTPAGLVPGAQVGDLFFTTTPGTFTAYAADSSSDLQLAGNDLNHYRYSLNGAVTGVSGTLSNIIQYGGSYRIFYDQDLNSTEDALVSAGTFSITATFSVGQATLAGFLTQTQGPSNPAFGDLSYGGSPVIYAGTYLEINPGVSGTLFGTLRQNAVPAPGAAAMLGLVGVVGAVRRRR